MEIHKNILILTVDAGFGHRSAAIAIAQALEDLYSDRCSVSIYNPLDHRSVPAFLRETQFDYDKFVRKMPDFYKFNFQISDSPVPSVLLESALTVLFFPSTRSLFREFKPDVILTTHPFYNASLNTYITLRKLPVPIINVITDITNLHRLWFYHGVDYCLLPSQEAYSEAISYGLSPEICRVTGIPIKPAFSSETRPKSLIRAELGWAPDVITALVLGSTRIKNLVKSLHLINHSGLPLQLILVAGGDEQLYQEFLATEWHTVTHIYNYVDRMPQFMKASDLIIGKAGGLTVTEAIACELPLLLVDVTPGQEEGNAKFVVEHAVGELAKDSVEALEIMYHWMENDHALLDERARNAARLGNPRSAFEVADLAWEAAMKGRSVSSTRLLSWVPRFRELLSTFGISETGEN